MIIDGDNHIMLDLETMGNGSNAAIIAIGAVRFSIPNKEILDKFYTTISLKSSVAAGGIIDPDTVLWWIQQNNEAKTEIINSTTSIEDALRDFSRWIGNGGIVWGNGATFDNVILRNAYKSVNLECPWSFRNDRCYRTIKELFPSVKIQDIGTKHNALDDALSQAYHLMDLFEEWL